MFDVAGFVHVTRLRRVSALSIAGDAVVPVFMMSHQQIKSQRNNQPRHW
jgi:hypothetical protein